MVSIRRFWNLACTLSLWSEAAFVCLFVCRLFEFVSGGSTKYHASVGSIIVSHFCRIPLGNDMHSPRKRGFESSRALAAARRVHIGRVYPSCFARVQFFLSPSHHQTQNLRDDKVYRFLSMNLAVVRQCSTVSNIHTTNCYSNSIRHQKDRHRSSCVARFGFSFRIASCVPLATRARLGFQLGAALVPSCQSYCLLIICPPDLFKFALTV
jgi:hypothetical protein